jgi:phenylalanyl-tRNA synthetase alpha chain
MDMKARLAELRRAFDDEAKSAADLAAVEKLRLSYLGRKGSLTQVLKGMGQVDPADRPSVGELAHTVRSRIESVLAEKKSAFIAEEERKKLAAESIDVTLPGLKSQRGNRHPLTQVMDDICRIFIGLGYQLADGPEIELADYNFTKLRLHETHPSRDPKDTFYFNAELLLRTHTSPVQIRTMEKTTPPLRIVVPGRVYRPDAVDATHSPFFHQVEGLAVDEGITMGDLVGSLTLYAKRFFGEETKIRLRPHHFPFTEPSCEVDITCTNCHGTGDAACRTCRGEGWIEVLGAGMVHPEVLAGCGIDPDRYSGFAFGIGVERTAMGRYGVRDIRAFTENDLRFLAQFA